MDSTDPQRTELTQALAKLRQAAEEHRIRQEAARQRTVWGSLRQGARAFTRFFGWAGS